MSKVAVVFWSGTGNTEAMADFVVEGAKAAGAQADRFIATAFSAEQMKTYNAVALGCPAMGAEQLEETEFEPLYESLKPELSGKAVGLFGSYGWGDGEWMRDWEGDCVVTGCRMAANPVIANNAPDDTAAEACRALGKALAQA